MTSVINRYYDPSTGNFFTVDPDVNETGQAYSYAGDDPVDGTDPSGLSAGLSGAPALDELTTPAERAAGANCGGEWDCFVSILESVVTSPVTSVYHAYDEIYQDGANGCSFFSLGVQEDVLGAVLADETAALTVDGDGEGELLDQEVPSVIYREGTPNPSNLTSRLSDNGSLSFRDSLSNPIDSSDRPVFRPGKSYFGVDTSQLPPGSVTFDGVPPGHVSVVGVSPEELKAAIIERDSFPK